MKHKRHKIAAIICAVLMAVCSGCGSAAVTGGELGESPNVESGEGQSPLIVTFIDVGQGDATLLQCGGSSMLIDAGKNDQGTSLQLFLQKQKVKELEYAVGTHPDEDHIGGLDVVITKFDVDHVLMPDRKSDTKTYRDTIQAAKDKSIAIENPEPGDTFWLGDAKVEVMAPLKKYEDNNNNSIVLMVEHGENRFLFTGDAEEEAEEDMLQAGVDLDADVLKVGHHGSRSSTSESFLQAVSPEAAVISCGEGNSYGHPHAQTMNSLRMNGIELYRTDESGTIVAYSDGESIEFDVPPSDSWIPGEPEGTRGDEDSEQAEASEKKQDYVLNINSGKFHKPDCSGARQIKESNKKEIKDSRENLIKQGYEPCGICNAEG